eukprot:TRINITY_DN176_c0_g1_i1.p1 TRINITY_DN176_c0_g1~~TRINITY_DN176_c0_g1_i1.p1  ORF type:complete len:388 (+),score=98.79 TRINITY_DN176_c0_g1_i1:42-1166(+)
MSLLYALDLPPSLIIKLQNAGIEKYEDLVELTLPTLVNNYQLTTHEIKLIYELMNNKPLEQKSMTLSEMMMAMNKLPPIVTFSQKIDRLLDGGIDAGLLFEIVGLPSVGKTQFCLQLAVSATLPEVVNGRNSDVLVLDTEGSFTLCSQNERLYNLAASTVSMVHDRLNAQNFQLDINYDIQKIMNSIYIQRILNIDQLIASIFSLEETLRYQQENGAKKIALIIIDSFSFHFRYGFVSYQKRNQLILNCLLYLSKIAMKNHISIVFTNHMTTKIDSNTKLIPAMGLTASTVPQFRLLLDFCSNDQKSVFAQNHGSFPNVKPPGLTFAKDDSSLRTAYLIKSPQFLEGSVLFRLSESGIQDFNENIEENIKRTPN